MKHLLTLLAVCAVFQLAAEAQDIKYRLYLTDKEGSEYCALSERAQQRRARQGIDLDSTDLVVSPRYLQALTEAGYMAFLTSRWLNTVVVGHADGTPADSATLAELPFVRKVQPVEGPSQVEAPSARRLRKWEGLLTADTVTDSFQKPMLEVNGQALYDAGYRGEGMLITMLDGGYTNATRYPVLSDKVVGWYDFYSSQDSAAFFSSSIHGTQCMSLMASDSCYGVWGTAPDARFFLIRTEFGDKEFPYEEDAWVAGAEMADSLGSDLLTSSLGYYLFDDTRFDHLTDELAAGTAFISRGAEIATRKGMLVICSAGNEGRPASKWGKITFPADAMDVLTVGATDPDCKPGFFTSWGWLEPYVKPDLACRGQQAYVLSAETGMPITGNGTSYAAPFFCGLMASLWSAAPTLLPEQLRQVVRESSSQYTVPDTLIGYGMPDFRIALQEALRLSGASGLEEVRPQEPVRRSFRYYDLQGRPLPRDERNVPSNCKFIVEKDGKIRVIR